MTSDGYLNDYSDEELEIEIERRKEAKSAPPEQVPDKEIDWSLVKTNAAEHIDNLERGTFRDDDEHFIYEAVMVALYGKDVWEWVNERLR